MNTQEAKKKDYEFYAGKHAVAFSKTPYLI